jgi:endonuclease YncB( thermonuclease family)
MKIALFCAAAVIGATAWGQLRESHKQTTGICHAIDGDTIRCGDQRIRLNGIDAPEMPGHCRRGRACVPGDPIASRDHLAVLLSHGPAQVEALKTDRYGRTVAQVTVEGIDLSCAQLDHASYIAKWDEGGRTAAACE